MTDFVAFVLIASLGMLVQSTVGFAGGLLAMPLLALLISPRDAVPSYALLMLLANGLLVWEGRQHIDGRPVRRMLLGGLPGVPIGALCAEMSAGRLDRRDTSAWSRWRLGCCSWRGYRCGFRNIGPSSRWSAC